MDSSPSSTSSPQREVILTPLGTEMTRITTPVKRNPKQSFFGVIPDAFESKSLMIGEGSPARSVRSGSRDDDAGSIRSSSTTSPQHQSAKTPPGALGSPADEILQVIVDQSEAGSVINEEIQLQTVSEMSAIPIVGCSAQNRLLIKGGKIVNDDMISEGDVYIEDGIIKQVGRDLTIPGGTRTIDARGKLVIPGGIDPHTHFHLDELGTRTVDDFYSGTKAALAGGTTTIMDFAIPESEQSLVDSYESVRNIADEKSCCDYSLHVVVTNWTEKIKNEMEYLVREKGINSFKMFMNDEHRISDNEMLSVMQWCREIGALAQVHAENGDAIVYNSQKLLSMGITGPEGHVQSRPEEVEAEATNRAITLANQVNCPVYIAHLNSKQSADVFVKRRLEGNVAFGEILAAALGTDGTHQYNKCWRHAAGHVTSPPLRPDPSTPSHLMNILSSGVIQVTASDHCTFNANQKAMGKDNFTLIPYGVNGVEDRMSIVWDRGVMSGKIDPCQFVAVTSTNAAKIFNIYPRKGRIAVGSDADIVVWNSRTVRTISAKTHHQNVDFNIFEGMSVHGVPDFVVANGRVVAEEGELRVTQGAGRFVPTLPFSPLVYMRIEGRDQVRVPIKIDRDPYEGPAADPNTYTNGSHKAGTSKSQASDRDIESPITSQQAPEFQYSRPLTKAGIRNLQDSSFSLSGNYGSQIDDTKGYKAGIKVQNPPGGHSTALW